MKKVCDLSAYMAALTQTLERDGRFGTAHVYKATLRRVRDFCGNRPLLFSHITAGWLRGFQNYLLERRLKWNTVSTYMRMLRAVYLRAVDEGLAAFQPRLFREVYTGTRVDRKRALEEGDLRRLCAMPQADPELERTRRLFLLLFMLRGIPFVDIAYLRRCDLQGDVLLYRRRKTGTCLRVRVEGEAMDFLRQLQASDPYSLYLFPFVRQVGAVGYRQYQNALRAFNSRLKRLAARVGCTGGLSSYTARHSWATLANYKNFQPELICNAMGHSSVKVTETYFKNYADEQIDEMNRSLMEAIFPHPQKDVI